MVAVQTFKIASEIVLHDSASAATEKIAAGFDKVSEKADKALTTVENFGLKMALQFTGFSGGIMGFLKGAIGASESFSKMQLGFSNIMASNQDFFTGADTFAERMAVAKKTIEDIVEESRNFGLSATELGEYTKGTAQILAPKGLTGDNFDIATDLSANFLKVIRTLPGLNAGTAQGQFGDLLTGSASKQGRFTRLLFKDAVNTFKEFGIDSAKQYNKVFQKDPAKAIEALSAAMSGLTRNSDELKGFTGLLTSKFKVLTDLFFGFSSILKPIGDALMKPLKQVLDFVIQFVQNDLKGVAERIGKVLSVFLEDPRQLLVRLMELKELGANASNAANFTGLVAIFGALASFSKVRSIPILGTMAVFFEKLMHVPMNFATIGAGIMTVFKFLGKFLGVFSIFLVMFQAWERAIAKFKIDNAVEFFHIMVNFWENLIKLSKRFLAPIDMIIEGWSTIFLGWIKLFVLLFGLQSTVQNLAGGLEFISEWFIKLFAIFKGFIQFFFSLLGELFAGLKTMVQRLWHFIKNLKFSDAASPWATAKKLGSALDPTVNYAGFFDGILHDISGVYRNTLRSNLVEIGPDGKAPAPHAKNEVNIGKVEINQDFKEKQNPDRIAFSIKEQILKTANNARTQGTKTMRRNMNALAVAGG